MRSLWTSDCEAGAASARFSRSEYASRNRLSPVGDSISSLRQPRVRRSEVSVLTTSRKSRQLLCGARPEASQPPRPSSSSQGRSSSTVCRGDARPEQGRVSGHCRRRDQAGVQLVLCQKLEMSSGSDVGQCSFSVGGRRSFRLHRVEKPKIRYRVGSAALLPYLLQGRPLTPSSSRRKSGCCRSS